MLVSTTNAFCNLTLIKSQITTVGNTCFVTIISLQCQATHSEVVLRSVRHVNEYCHTCILILKLLLAHI